VKKLLTIALLLIYGLSSSGMTLQFNYCCGKLKSIKLTPLAKIACDMKQPMGSKPCCDHRQVDLKIKSDQKAEAGVYNLFAPTAIIANQSSLVSSPAVISIKVIPEIFAPPPLQNALHILYCIYRI
jgi:hypothetical protein